MDTIDWSSKSKESASAMVENMRKRIHVLLVDHHDPPIAMLEHFFLQVTTVKFASTGLAILSKGKAKFDLVLENIHSPDACGFKLLREAVKIDLPVILLFEEDDIMLTKRALEVGALLCIKKPITEEITRYFWQLVLWEKRRSRKKIDEHHYNMQNGVGEFNFIEANNHTIDGNAISSEESQNRNKKLKRENSISISISSSSSASDNHEDTVSLRTKVWTEWTQDLHDQFMAAVRKLGEGRCYPKDILEMMNVPGLTRMQVASHLQKCRSGSWIPPNKRKAKTSSAVAAKRLLFNSRKKFGFMPSSSSNQTHHHINTPTHQYSENMDYSIQFPHLTTQSQFFEFPNMDSIFQSFCASEEEVPISYNVPVMNNANVEKWENTSKVRDDDDDDDNDDDGKTDQLVVKTEGV